MGYPDDFKGTNMDSTADMSVDRKLRAMDALPVHVLEFIRDYNLKHGLESQVGSHEHGYLQDLASDLYCDERHSIVMNASIAYERPSAEEIFNSIFQDMARFNARTPMLKLPKGEAL